MRRLLIVFPLLLRLGSSGFAEKPPAALAEQLEKGAAIYAEKCLMCHQATGQGAPPVFPPLAGSDWLADRAKTIKVLCEGLSGEIQVNGQKYRNAMPAQVLDDAQVAAVLTYVANSWGNQQAAFTADEVRSVRAQTRFPTFDALVKATSFQPLPQAPAGWKLREVAQLPEFCTRLASDGTGRTVYVLQQNGGVLQLDPASGALTPLIDPADYLDLKRGGQVALGCTVDREGRLWIVTNQKLTENVPIYTNEVVIWRSAESAEQQPLKLLPWFKTTYPHGVGGFNHGVSHMAFGPGRHALPEQRLAHGCGRREHRSEALQRRRSPRDGVPLAARSTCRRAEGRGARSRHPQRLRLRVGWEGNLFTVSNGPDASAPEEMDFIEPGKHYGFPFQIRRLAGQSAVPLQAHASSAGRRGVYPAGEKSRTSRGRECRGDRDFRPALLARGLVWCGDAYPEPLRNRFVITRFGNLLGEPAAPEDVGFDVLTAKLQRAQDGRWEARIETLLAPLGRPLDVHAIRRKSPADPRIHATHQLQRKAWLAPGASLSWRRTVTRATPPRESCPPSPPPLQAESPSPQWPDSARPRVSLSCGSVMRCCSGLPCSRSTRIRC
jgi:mono/diheme cytochrome c family protein